MEDMEVNLGVKDNPLQKDYDRKSFKTKSNKISNFTTCCWNLNSWYKFKSSKFQRIINYNDCYLFLLQEPRIDVSLPNFTSIQHKS